MSKFWKIDNDVRIIPIALPPSKAGLVLSFSDKHPFEIGTLTGPDVNNVFLNSSIQHEHFHMFQLPMESGVSMVYVLVKSLHTSPSSISVNITPKPQKSTFSLSDNIHYVYWLAAIVLVLIVAFKVFRKSSQPSLEL